MVPPQPMPAPAKASTTARGRAAPAATSEPLPNPSAHSTIPRIQVLRLPQVLDSRTQSGTDSTLTMTNTAGTVPIMSGRRIT